MLEDRMVPSTLNVDFLGHAVYTGSPGAPNNITLSEKFLILDPPGSGPKLPTFIFEKVITDTVETINVTGPGASRWGGSGTHQVVSIQPVPSLVVDVISGNEVVNVQAIDSPTLVRHLGPGLAQVNVGNGGKLSGIGAALTVDGAGPGSFVHLTIDDSADSLQTVLLNANSIQVVGLSPPITFVGGVQAVDVIGGNGDTYREQTFSSTTPVIVHGLGSSALFSGPGINDWIITGINAGSLHNVTFLNVPNLRGGSASIRDTFHFNDKMGVTGSIFGASKITDIVTLDYSKYTVPLTVDLKLNLAHGGFIATLVANINNVLGGQANNILVGDGNNFLRGGNGRDILISGGGTTTLQAGVGEAILLGAHYVFDISLPVLNNLMAMWSAPLPYAVRVNNLLASGAISLATAKPQPGATTLISGVGLDFLIIDPGDILAKPVRPGERVFP
jgi:Ca2+-binding RTX toxin-like protein